MGLTVYGLVSTGFAFTKLKNNPRDRSIEAIRGIRKQVTQPSEDEVGKAPFRFLNLPPELRNMVYAELLTSSEQAQRSGTSRYHPNILAACKQTHYEANGLLNDDRYAELSFNLHDRKVRNAFGLLANRHGLDIFLNGTRIYCAEEDNHPEALMWPSLLRKVRSLTLTVNLTVIEQCTSYGDMYQEIAMNQSMHFLYTFLAKNASATALKIVIKADLEAGSISLENALTPLSALAARISESSLEFSNITEDTMWYLQAHTNQYRRLFRLEEEVDLAIKIHSLVNKKLPSFVQRYGELTAPACKRGLFQWNGYNLESFIDCIERYIDKLISTSADSWPKNAVEEVTRLHKMRADRKLEEVEIPSE